MMNQKIITVTRLVLALLMIIFGVNKFANFLPPFELEGDAANYFMALEVSYTLTAVGILEIITGAALLFNRYTALALIINAPLAINAVLFHATLDPVNVGPAVFWLALVLVLLFANKSKYESLLTS